ncbi:MAG TPA: hypothetical protein ENN14_01745 [Chloroflexi bacterium]|nr:hypothetical protein [Chloroflexota bacterium]
MKINPTSNRKMTGLTLALLGLLALLSFALQQPADTAPLAALYNPHLGTCFSFYDETWITLAYEAGSRWDRLDFRWDVIEPTQGAFNFAPHENVVAFDLEHGLDIVGILWATPGWAAACPTDALALHEIAPPPGYPQSRIAAATATSNCPPANLTTWTDYISATVAHFAPLGVHTWEIWNEPDLPLFWRGTPAQYADLLRSGYLAAKAANPEATVLFGGLAFWHDRDFYFYTQVLAHLATDPNAATHNGYFDVMSLHLYSDVYTAYDISREVQQNVARYVGPHPLWLTESGVPIWDEDFTQPYPYSATGEEAAAYMLQSYALARAAGVERYFFFRVHDDYQPGNAMSERFGFTRDDHSLRPAYAAYQVAAHYLYGENQITAPLRTPISRVTFWGTPLGRIDVLWNATNAPLTYTQEALLPTATLVDHRGITQTLTPISDTYVLPLGPATNNNHPDGSYIIGGPPLLLIQTDTEAPTTTLHALLESVATSAITVSWTVSDTGAGYWYLELARAPSPTGPWTRVAGWGQTEYVTQTQVQLPASGTWYFRARARDRVGNWERWPAIAQISTTLPERRLFLPLVSR